MITSAFVKGSLGRERTQAGFVVENSYTGPLKLQSARKLLRHFRQIGELSNNKKVGVVCCFQRVVSAAA